MDVGAAAGRRLHGSGARCRPCILDDVLGVAEDAGVGRKQHGHAVGLVVRCGEGGIEVESGRVAVLSVLDTCVAGRTA